MKYVMDKWQKNPNHSVIPLSTETIESDALAARQNVFWCAQNDGFPTFWWRGGVIIDGNGATTG